jgi:hypothetical protein
MSDSVLFDDKANAAKPTENLNPTPKEEPQPTVPAEVVNEVAATVDAPALVPQVEGQAPVMDVVANSNDVVPEEAKRPREGEEDAADGSNKKQRSDEAPELDLKDVDDSNVPPIPPSKEGVTFFHDNDVLSGRGGGTNVHPGNRNFRDLINLHRRAYLKARKNDKPAISRAIVRSIRQSTGRFLKRDEKSGMWYEIGDDAAREKTSQALRQRAPEMRKLLFESEREEARAVAEEHIRHQRMMMGMPGDYQQMPPGMPPGMPPMMPPGMNPMMNPALFQMANKNGYPQGMVPQNMGQDPYSQMSQNLMTAALLGGGINRYAPNGA